MVERNPHQEWGSGVNVLFRELRSKAKAADAVPLGQERLTPSESKARFAQMTKPEREKFIASRGEQEIIRMLKE